MGNLGMGARDRLLQATKLQRLEIAARHGLSGAIEHEGPVVAKRARHGHPDNAAKRAAFALSRSNVLALSTTNRVWVPAPT